MTEYEPRIGDIVLCWQKHFMGKALAFVISRVFGIVDPPNHAEIVVSKSNDLSAEVNGVVLKPRAKTFNENSKTMIIRHRGMTEARQKEILSKIFLYRGCGYDYFNHARWFLQFLSITTPLMWIVFTPLYKWLKKKSVTRWHCSELVARLYHDAGLNTGYEDISFVAPHHFLHLARASVEWEIVWEKLSK